MLNQLEGLVIHRSIKTSLLLATIFGAMYFGSSCSDNNDSPTIVDNRLPRGPFSGTLGVVMTRDGSPVEAQQQFAVEVDGNNVFSIPPDSIVYYSSYIPEDLCEIEDQAVVQIDPGAYFFLQDNEAIVVLNLECEFWYFYDTCDRGGSGAGVISLLCPLNVGEALVEGATCQIEAFQPRTPLGNHTLYSVHLRLSPLDSTSDSGRGMSKSQKTGN